MDHERLEQVPGHTSPSRDEWHTPLPWRIYDSTDRYAVKILGVDPHSGNAHVASALGKANAELIVRAVNSHADLLTALKLSLQRLSELNRDDEAGMRIVIANAISKAETR